MFWRVLDLAAVVGARLAATDQQSAWVKALQELLKNEEDDAPLASYSPDVDVFEIFSSREEAGFWSDVLFAVAERVFQREFGASEEARIQTETVWAAYDLAALLRKVANRPRQVEE